MGSGTLNNGGRPWRYLVGRTWSGTPSQVPELALVNGASRREVDEQVRRILDHLGRKFIRVESINFRAGRRGSLLCGVRS